MNARTALTFTLTAFLAVFSLAFINGIHQLGVPAYRFISPNDIRGMAIEHQKVLYTLNFDQQNALVEAFNLAIPSMPDVKIVKETPVRKIVIYRFNAPDMYVELMGLTDNSQHKQMLIFKNLEWFPGLLNTPIPDSYTSMLSNTYDHYSPQ